MAKITYIQPDGAEATVASEPGMTVMETAKKHLIEGIEAECLSLIHISEPTRPY